MLIAFVRVATTKGLYGGGIFWYSAGFGNMNESIDVWRVSENARYYADFTDGT
jgi:hypothetical protein